TPARLDPLPRELLLNRPHPSLLSTLRNQHDHLGVPRLQHGPRRLRYDRRREAPEAKAKIRTSHPSDNTENPYLKVPARIQGDRRGQEPSSP
ncbi:hypothetical protein V496_10283, partial [Pseudogymnoascus sp. VKM F-4515 (FW-2607)]